MVSSGWRKNKAHSFIQTNTEREVFQIGIVGGGVQLGPLGTAATNGLLCQPRVLMPMEKLVEWLARELKYSEKTCPSAALSTTNPICCPDAKPGHCGGKPASNRLCYSTAWKGSWYQYVISGDKSRFHVSVVDQWHTGKIKRQGGEINYIYIYIYKQWKSWHIHKRNAYARQRKMGKAM
jgi:hypothetical protein